MTIKPITDSSKLDAYIAQIPQPGPQDVRDHTIFKVAEIFKKYGLCDFHEIAWNPEYRANFDVHTQRIMGGQIHGVSPADLGDKDIAWMRAPDGKMAFMIQGKIIDKYNPERVLFILSQLGPQTANYVHQTGCLDLTLNPFYENSVRDRLEAMLKGLCEEHEPATETTLGKNVQFQRGVFDSLPIHRHNRLKEMCQITRPITSY